MKLLPTSYPEALEMQWQPDCGAGRVNPVYSGSPIPYMAVELGVPFMIFAQQQSVLTCYEDSISIKYYTEPDVYYTFFPSEQDPASSTTSICTPGGLSPTPANAPAQAQPQVHSTSPTSVDPSNSLPPYGSLVAEPGSISALKSLQTRTP